MISDQPLQIFLSETLQWNMQQIQAFGWVRDRDVKSFKIILKRILTILNLLSSVKWNKHKNTFLIYKPNKILNLQIEKVAS